MSKSTFQPICTLDIFQGMKKYYGYKRTTTKNGETRTYFVLSTSKEQKTSIDGVEIHCSDRPADYQKPDLIYIETTSDNWDDLKSKCIDGEDIIFHSNAGQTLTNQSFKAHYEHFNPNGEMTE